MTLKKIMAKDSERLIVMDDNVKNVDLFTHVLPRVAGFTILGGLSTYGLLKGIPFKWMLAVDKFQADPWNQLWFVLSLLSIVGFRWLYKKLK